MLLLRVAAILVVITLGASLVLYLTTRNRRYLKFSWNLFRFAVLFALVFFALLVLERVMII
jgi:hypothetical protein